MDPVNQPPKVKSWEEVFREERDKISLRRGEAPNQVANDRIGLAISGGGIRSATFALGVLEGLKDKGLLKSIDYLSTVSGGGYIGAWLSANCRRVHNNAIESPTGDGAPSAAVDWLDREANWLESIRHLRRYSKYLSPSVGFFSADTWSMVAIWLRNTMLVQATVILALATLLVLPRLLFSLFQFWYRAHDWRWATVVIFVLAAAGIAGNQLRVTLKRNVKFLTAAQWPKGAIIAALLLGFAYVVRVVFDFHPFEAMEVRLRPAFLTAIALVGAGFAALPVGVMLIGFCARIGRSAQGSATSLAASEPVPQRLNYTQAWAQRLVVLPLLATGFLVAAILWGQAEHDDVINVIDSYGMLLKTEWQHWPFPLYIALVSLWMFWVCSVPWQSKERDLRWQLSRLLGVVFGPLPAAGILYLLLCALLYLMHGWAVTNAVRGTWLAFVWGPSLVLFFFSVAIVLLIGMTGRLSSEGVREWWSRLGAWLTIYGIAWMVVAISTVYGPRAAAALMDGHLSVGKLSAIGGWLATAFGGLLAGTSSDTGAQSGEVKAKKSAGVRFKELVAVVGPFVFIAGLLIGVSVAVHLIILNLSSYGESWSIETLYECHWFFLTMSGADFHWVVLVAAAVAIATALLAYRVDINVFSLNEFYRSRLVRCYLGATRYKPGLRKPQNFTQFDDDDDLPLADLAPKGNLSGPLHIINCALNLGGSSDLSMHTRHSASFMFTPFSTGTTFPRRDRFADDPAKAKIRDLYEARPALGFQRTSDYSGEVGYPTLGQAISVSGAAASPNMGYHTSPVVAFMLTMFNARLGWWFPNPGKSLTSPSPGFSLRYLIMELFGVAREDSDFLMISDGGHFENLAAYELIRRQCAVVIISDAECDPKLQFEGLGNLIRICEVDFGVRIQIDVDPIRRDAKSGKSSQRHALGLIHYPDGQQTGHLLYLKAATTGGESAAIRQYQDSHLTFPHESTGNQFYGEDQFESYRHLGSEAVQSLLANVKIQNPGHPWLDVAKECFKIYDAVLDALRQKGSTTDH